MTRYVAGMALGLVVSSILVLGINRCSASEPEDRAEFDTRAHRYHEILVKRPTRGATFDLWYRHYLDAGRLDELFRQVEDDARNKPGDYAAQMLLGLVFERQGRENEATQAYERAQKIEPGRFEPPFLRGLLLARLSRIDEAAGALGEALRRDPPRGEFLELAKRLGQIQLRQGKSNEAIATWSRLVDRFPNDRRVLAELAQLLTDEGQYDEAIKRWEQVADAAGEDRHLRLTARIAVAQLQLRKGNPETAVTLFDQALDQVDPESWLARDIQRRIESAYQKRDNLKGLVDYYARRSRRRPDDLIVCVRLAHALAKADRGEDAINEYRAVIKSAPGRRDLREALIEELTRLGKKDEALAESRTLAEAYPKDVEILKRLGRLILSAAPDENRGEAEAEACRVWSRISAIRPDDPSLSLQVAETCRQAALAARSSKNGDQAEAGKRLLETAEASYREAVRRSHGAPGDQENLGEFLHAQGRRDEALAAWNALAAPPRDSPENLRQLSDILDRFGFVKEAIAAGEQALAKAPENLDARMRQARLLIKGKEFEKAIAQVDQIDRLAENSVQVEKALQLRVDALSGAGKVEPEIARLQKERKTGPARPKDQWLLGLLLQNLGRYGEAARSLDLAADDPHAEARVLQAAAEAHEKASDRLGALRIYRCLAERDPRQAVAYYEKIAELELEVGGVAAAREAADALIRHAPADLDGYRLRAEIAFKLGETEDGLRTLLRGVRIAPRDVAIRSELARALAKAGRIAEANEHYWRAFEMADALSDKLPVVVAMAELAVATQGQDRLLGQLRRLQRGQEDPEKVTLCLVEALKTFRDLNAARQELEKLAEKRPDDREILKLLAHLAEEQREWKTAVAYQERLVALAPDRDHLETLISYYQRLGDRSRAGSVLARLLESSHDPEAFITAVEREMKQGAFREAIALADAGRAKWPDAWPLHFLAGVAHLANRESNQADQCFQAVLDCREGVFKRASPPASKPPGNVSPGLRSRIASALNPPGPIVPANQTTQVQVQVQVQGPLDNLAPGALPDLDDLRLVQEVWPLFQEVGKAGPNALSPQRKAQDARARSQLSQVQRQMLEIQRQIQVEQAQHQNQMPVPEASRQRVAQLQAQHQQLLQMHQNLQLMVTLKSNRDVLTLAQDERTARLASLIGRLAVASSESGAKEATWIARLRQQAETDPDRSRALVLVLVAENRFFDARLANDRLAEARPDVAFPHVARLYLLSAYAPPWKGAGREYWKALSIEERARQRDAAIASFEWLAARLPQTRYELTRYFGLFQIHALDDVKSVVPIIARLIPMTDRIEDLAGLTELASAAENIPLQRALFARALELAAVPGDPLTMLTALNRVLETSSLDARDDGYLGDLLAILDVCFKTRLPDGLDTKPKMSAAIPGSGTINSGAIRVGGVTQTTIVSQAAASAFPRPGPLLDAPRLEALQRTWARFVAAKRTEMLYGHLEKEGKNGEKSLRPAYLLARVALEWWSGKTVDALARLERYEKETPLLDEGALGLALVHCYMVSREKGLAIRTLTRIRPGSETMAIEADQLRAEIGRGLLGDDAHDQVNALLLMLGSQTRAPEIAYLYGDPYSMPFPRTVAVPQLTRTATGAMAPQLRLINPQPRQPVAPAPLPAPAPVPTSANPVPGMPGQPMNNRPNQQVIVRQGRPVVQRAVPPLNVRRVLEQAKANGKLDEIERAATAQSEKHPNDSPLIVLVALARYARSDPAGAAKAAGRWSELLKSNGELAGEPEATWLASRCLGTPETRALGRQIAREVLATARVRGFVEPHRDLLIQILQASVEDGQKDEALDAIQQLKSLLGTGPNTLY